MLVLMRRVAKSFMAKGLMLLLILSFGIWGIGDIFRGHSNTWLATVGNEHVLAIDFSTQRAMMRQAITELGIKNLDNHDIDNEVLRRMIQQHLVSLWLKDSGLFVNRAMEAQAIRDNRQFKDITGKFDKELFAQILKQKRLSETGYLIQLRGELAEKAIFSSLDMGDSVMPDSQKKFETATETQTRDVLLITVPVASVDEATIDDEKLQKFYEARKGELYMEPEYRTLEYITMDSADLVTLIDQSITEAMLHERYETHQSIAPSFEEARPELQKQLRSEHRDAVLQNFSTSIEDALAGGSTVGEAVAKAGVKAESKLLTRIAAAQLAASTDPLLSAVAAQGFLVASGETSGLRTSANGRYYIVTVKEVVAAAPKPLEEVKGDVRAQVAKEIAVENVRAKAQKVKDALLIADEQERNAALAALSVSGRSVGDITRPASDAKGGVKSTQSQLPVALQQSVFEHRVGEVAGPLMQADGSAMVALITATHQPTNAMAEESLAALQSTYNQTLTEAVRGAMFNALADTYTVHINQPLLQQITQAGQ